MQDYEFKYRTDNNFLRFTGYSYDNVKCLEHLFSKENIDSMSRDITEFLKGVSEDGRDIVVPNDRISAVLSSVQENYIATNAGDIHTRYTIERAPIDDYAMMRAQAVNIIVTNVRDSLGMEQNNKKLDVWNTVLGEQNPLRIRGHDILSGYIRKRRPTPMQFNMKY